MKILILGHGNHGKDTLASLLKDLYGLTFKSSSELAAEIFIYIKLRDTHGYTSYKQCYEDRRNHRALWHDLIAEYNKNNKARLAKEILQLADMYVGMRANDEVEECLKQKLFDLIIGIYDPRKPEEPKDSFNINLWEKSDIVIPNAGTIEELRKRVIMLRPLIQAHYLLT
jgi:hypothetical protein